MDRFKSLFGGVGLAGIFAFSFVFFLYFTFPYGVLKEAITAQINRATAFDVRIGSMTPSFPLGIEAENVVVRSESGGQAFKIKSAEIDLSIFRLLLMQVYVSAELSTGVGEELDVDAKFGIFDLIGGNPLPSDLYVLARDFEIGGLAGFALSSVTDSIPDPMVSSMLQPVLERIVVEGKIDGQVKLSLDAHDLKQSNGNVSLRLKNSSFEMAPNLGIAPQIFSRFLVKASMTNGKFRLDKSSGMKSAELTLDMGGSVELKDKIENSLLDLQIFVELAGDLKESFGLVVDSMMKGNAGKAKMAIRGSFAYPRYEKF